MTFFSLGYFFYFLKFLISTLSPQINFFNHKELKVFAQSPQSKTFLPISKYAIASNISKDAKHQISPLFSIRLIAKSLESHNRFKYPFTPISLPKSNIFLTAKYQRFCAKFTKHNLSTSNHAKPQTSNLAPQTSNLAPH